MMTKWSYVVYGRVRWWSVTNIVMKFWILQNSGTLPKLSHYQPLGGLVVGFYSENLLFTEIARKNT